MHETFQKIGHLPVNVHFTMNRYPIRNHQCVISKAGFTKTIKSHPIPESILFPTEDNFDPTLPDCRRFRWKEHVKFLFEKSSGVEKESRGILDIESSSPVIASDALRLSPIDY